jgi:hypothetical protein
MFPPTMPASVTRSDDDPVRRMVLEQCRLAESTAPYMGMPAPAPWLVAAPTVPTTSDVAVIPEL